MKISIIIPARNEAEHIGILLSSLQRYRSRGHEVIVVDGGSNDSTVQIAGPLVDKLLQTDSGRARQMNAGASEANGDVLWFLHADSQVPDKADKLISNSLINGVTAWGWFDICLSGRSVLFRMIEAMMNLRSRLTRIATGDQGIFVSRKLFVSIGGFPDQSLMEDIAISSKLKKCQQPVTIREKLVTSSRRWEQQGIVRTILKMWVLRMAYFLGVPADRLALRYE